MTASALVRVTTSDTVTDSAALVRAHELLAELTARIEALTEHDPGALSTATPTGRSLARLAGQARVHAAVLGRPATDTVSHATGVVVVRDAVMAARELSRALGR